MIKFVKKEYERIDGKWVEVDCHEKFVDAAFFRRYTSPQTVSFFRGLGGIEDIDQFVRNGSRVVQVTSISPCRQLKKVTTFYFP